jgi:selT/selW/selH-like putative selenoprotein
VHGIEAELRPGETGAFEVLVNGKKIFSKKALGRFPEPEEILRHLH